MEPNTFTRMHAVETALKGITVTMPVYAVLFVVLDSYSDATGRSLVYVLLVPWLVAFALWVLIRQRNGRRLQLRLSWLMVMTAVCAVFLALWAVEVEPYRMERRAIAELDRLGARYEMKSGGLAWLREHLGREKFQNVVQASFRGTDLDDDRIATLKRLTKIRELDLGDSQVTDDGLVHLRGRTQLVTLNLLRLPITGAGLVHLEELTDLEHLTLSGTAITDADLLHLQKLKNLRRLDLNDTKITDQGLRHLKLLPMLEDIRLYGTEVSDDGLTHLASLPLKMLNLNSTNVTPRGVKQISEASPGVSVTAKTRQPP